MIFIIRSEIDQLHCFLQRKLHVNLAIKVELSGESLYPLSTITLVFILVISLCLAVYCHASLLYFTTRDMQGILFEASLIMHERVWHATRLRHDSV